MIRRAKFADVPQLFALLCEAYARSKYRDQGGIDVQEAKALFVRAIQRHGAKQADGMFAYVAEHEGKVTGFIIGVLQRVYLVGDRLEAHQVYFYQSLMADPVDTVALAKAFDLWANNVPNTIVATQSATDIVQEFPHAASLYEKLGYKQSGVIYERPIR